METGPDGLMLFDGQCRFCSGSVGVALALDRRGVIRFTPIQSPYGRMLAAQHGLDPDDPTTFVFFEGGRPLFRSEAALALARRLDRPWRWAASLRVLPRRLRDAVYDWVARHRYRLWGRRDTCRLPRPGEAERFVLEPPQAG